MLHRTRTTTRTYREGESGNSGSGSSNFGESESQEPGHQQPLTQIFSEDPFRARFGHRLPRGLREEARGMSWNNFVRRYNPASQNVNHGGSTLALRNFTSQRGRAGRNFYQADLVLGIGSGQETHRSIQVEAMGSVSAITNMLADSGYRVEIIEFHQFEIFEATVTFLYTSHNHRKVWTLGFGQTSDGSIINAMVSAAHRLHH